LECLCPTCSTLRFRCTVGNPQDCGTDTTCRCAFTWASGVALNYTAWQPQSPDTSGDCVTSSSDIWDLRACNNLVPAVCEAPAVMAYNPPPPPPADVLSLNIRPKDLVPIARISENYVGIALEYPDLWEYLAIPEVVNMILNLRTARQRTMVRKQIQIY
jgi:hypothetical protein